MCFSKTTLANMLVDIEINFIGRVPSSAIFLRLLIDDTTHEYEPKERGRTVRWNCVMCVSMLHLYSACTDDTQIRLSTFSDNFKYT